MQKRRGNGFEVVKLRPPDGDPPPSLSAGNDHSINDNAAPKDPHVVVLAEVLDDSGRVGPMFEVRGE